MSDDELRIEVAKLCGWRYPKWNGSWMVAWREEHPHVTKEIPDYPNDLNAMYEVEKILVEVQKRKYANVLLNIIKPDEYYGEYDIIHATARQRAEAFIKTMKVA